MEEQQLAFRKQLSALKDEIAAKEKEVNEITSQYRSQVMGEEEEGRREGEREGGRKEGRREEGRKEGGRDREREGERRKGRREGRRGRDKGRRGEGRGEEGERERGRIKNPKFLIKLSRKQFMHHQIII